MPTRFVAAGSNAENLTILERPEFGFVGRSNVGKSSLIGKLIGAPKLVRVSRTPGRTQTLNLFECRNDFAVVDLPGYGYAKLSKKHRASLQKMIYNFVAERESLKGIVQIVDARRDKVSDDDLELHRWVLEHERPLVLVITKVDLIAKNKRLKQIRAIEEAMGCGEKGAVLCSSKTGEGCKLLYRRLMELAK